MNKNIFAGLAVSAVMALAATAPVMASNGAVVIDDDGCGMLDQYGNVTVSSDTNHRVYNSSGNGLTKCVGTTPNDSGKAIRYSGFACLVWDGDEYITTYRSWEVIDSEGNATLTCQIK